MQFVNNNLGWILAGVILVIGLAFGFGDLLRFSGKRVWAISGISWSESVRRRILWITPVAILGIVVVSQLQKPVDEQDAIRQTVKICLFATGLVVVMSTIILACTNLPREIENRVIYTVVTKPTTRLEIVLGKVVGFARVSAAILLIMGVFSFAYLTLRAWNMQRYIGERIEAPGMAQSTRETLKHYQQTGLLTARTLKTANNLQVYARLPEPGMKRWYMSGGGDASFLVPFFIAKEDLIPPGVNAPPGASGALIVLKMGYQSKPEEGAKGAEAQTPSPSTKPAATAPAVPPYYGPYIMSPEERAAIMAGSEPQANPIVMIDILDRFQYSLGTTTNPLQPTKPLELTNKDGVSTVIAQVPANVAGVMGGQPIYIRVTGGKAGVEYYAEENPLKIRVQAQPDQIAGELAKNGLPPQQASVLGTVIAAANAGIEEAKAQLAQFQQQLGGQAQQQQEAARLIGSFTPREFSPASPTPIFQSRSGTFGQQLAGAKGGGSFGVYRFEDSHISSGASAVTFEGRFGIERSGDEVSVNEDQPTEVSVRVRNNTTGNISQPVIVKPESNRPTFFSLPADAVSGGKFDVVLQTLTPGHFVGLLDSSVALIANRQPFAWNLFKSLLILWLMSVLVIAVAIMTSTFLSWPIAVVLTLLILLGHWGVQQLGDATQPGIGNQIVTDLGLQESAPAKAVSATVEQLSWILNFMSRILPDISKYTAVEDIERGVTVSMQRLQEALMVTLGFGIPLTVLAYVVLKNKEVAP